MTRAENLATVVAQLRVLRERLGLRRIDVANAAAVSTRTLARLESGKDVQLWSYLAITHYYLTCGPVVLPADVARSLPPGLRELLIGRMAEPSS